MRPTWRQLAMRAEKRAWSADEVGDAFCAAVRDDFKREVSGDFMMALNGVIGASRQYSMFAEQGAEQLAELRAITADGSFAESIVDYLDIALRGGRVGEAALQESLQKACKERGAEGLRQVEEHYKREASSKTIEHVRDRLEAGLQSSQFACVAEGLLTRELGDVSRRARHKEQGLDAGPVLGE